MTDPLIEVAGEMEEEVQNSGAHDACGTIFSSAVKEWAARIRAFWTPQRKAFYAVAEQLGRVGIDAMDDLGFEVRADFAAKWKRLVESERGESEVR